MFIKAKFNEKDNTDHYKAHLTNLTQWDLGKLQVVDNLCKKWFNCGGFVLFLLVIRDANEFYSCNAEAVNIEATSCVTDEAQLCARQELEGRTGKTDSEADDDNDVYVFWYSYTLLFRIYG